MVTGTGTAGWMGGCGSVPEPVRSQAEAAYRATWHSITGADPGGQLADACAGWLIRGDALVERARRGSPGYLTQLPHKDWRWGTATARQRLLHRLTAVAALAANHSPLACLGQVSQTMRDQIRQRWADTRPLPAARENPSTTLDTYADEGHGWMLVSALP